MRIVMLGMGVTLFAFASGWAIAGVHPLPADVSHSNDIVLLTKYAKCDDPALLGSRLIGTSLDEIDLEELTYACPNGHAPQAVLVHLDARS